MVEAQRVGERVINYMTSYANEEDFLKDQIRSNNLAIRYMKQQIQNVESEFLEDYVNTKEKIINIYIQGVEMLEEETLAMKQKLSD